ncbi:MAG TPA: hypothetical protein VMA83_02430 [Solirubrobacteraceae bacterium]|nr:hypothetical protein [Solirubrobacteraceae bacterium]
MDVDGRALVERVSALPGGDALIALGPGTMLVGGALRDLLLGADPTELDATVGEPGIDAAQRLAAALTAAGVQGVAVESYPRFLTASVSWPGARVDVAQRRAESYARPGALPDVRPGDLAADLARRDFTINAIALELAGVSAGELHGAEHALDDLRAGLLRVLHDASFTDDPTRALRIARYSARLGFAVEARTAELLEQALAGGALDTVSRPRLGAEIRLMLAEADPLQALGVAERLGVWAALGARFDGELAAAALVALAGEGRDDALLLGLLFKDAEDPARALDEMDFGAGERERASAAARPEALIAAVAQAQQPSALARALAGHPAEQVASAVALGGPVVAEKVALWRAELQPVKLAIGARDLIDAGVPSGPTIAARLERVLALRLDGAIPADREAELRAALESP